MKFRDLWGRRGWTQHLEFLRPGSSGLGGSDVIAAEMEQVVDLIGAERKGCAWPADLNRFICRRRCVGWCEVEVQHHSTKPGQLQPLGSVESRCDAVAVGRTYL